MTEINTENYILEFNPKTAKKEELQKVYAKVMELYDIMPFDNGNYEKWNRDNNELMYKITYNISRLCDLYNFSINNEKKFLYKEFLYKACEFNDLIEITKESTSIVNKVNRSLRISLLEKLTQLGDQESLDKAYNIVNQISLNPEGIAISELRRLTERLLDKYYKHLDEENEVKIKELINKLEELKQQEKEVKNYVLGFNPKTAKEEELRKMYVTIVKLCNGGTTNDNYETWSKNELKYNVAYNILKPYMFYDPSIDNEKKFLYKEFLYKACEFNDSIKITEEDSFMVSNLNYYLRTGLLRKLIQLGDRESLDKAYDILNQISQNPESITVKELNDLKYNLIRSYLELNTPESINTAKEIFNSIDLTIVGNELNNYIKLQHDILRKEQELYGINIQENYEDIENNIEEEIVNTVINQTFEEERQRAQDDLYTLDNIETNISADQTVESFIDSLATEMGREYLINSLFVKYFTDPFIGNLSKKEQREVEEFIKLSKEYFLDENKEIEGIEIYEKIAVLISNSNAVSEYATDIVLESMNYSSNIGIVIDMINTGNDLNKIKEKSVSTMFKKLVTATLKRKEVSEQKIEEEKEEEKKQINPRITTTEDLQQQSNDLSSTDEEFNMVEAKQQATTLNEDINNYGLVTNEFSDEMEEGIDFTSAFN